MLDAKPILLQKILKIEVFFKLTGNLKKIKIEIIKVTL